MKKTTVTFTYDEEKMNAVKVFLAQKNSSVEEEGVIFLDALYKKIVPASVREFIDLKGGGEPEKKKPVPKTHLPSAVDRGDGD
ncbi:MAG: DUF6103 family protein [Clostridiales Family XIII bacterium]|nr:DUF6103 family protein [Clostridiales Family XIII bacterium]